MNPFLVISYSAPSPGFAKYWFTPPTGKPDNESELFSRIETACQPSGKLHTKVSRTIPDSKNLVRENWINIYSGSLSTADLYRMQKPENFSESRLLLNHVDAARGRLCNEFWACLDAPGEGNSGRNIKVNVWSQVGDSIFSGSPKKRRKLEK